MKIKTIVSLCVVCVCIVSGFILYSVMKEDSISNFKAKQGVLDLSHIRLEDNKPIKLDREWEFIPDKVVSSQEFSNLPSYIVPLPSLWSKYELDGKPVKAYTSGTYRLKVRIDNLAEKPIQYVDERYMFACELETDVKLATDILQKKPTSKGIKQLLQIYTGDYLLQEDYLWSIEFRKQIRNTVYQFLEEYIILADAQSKKGIEYKESLEKLLEFDPWDEEVVMKNILYFQELGKHRKVWQVYNEYCRTLNEELGVEPSEELKQLMKKEN